MLLPLIEILVRRLFGVGVPGSGPIVQHLTLWVGFLGAAIAAREGKLLALASASLIPDGRFRRAMEAFAAAVAAAVSVILASGGVDTAFREHHEPKAAFNLGMKMGLDGRASLIPLAVVWLICGAVLAVELTGPRQERRTLSESADRSS